ncbi:MAG: SRPBCC domain-containing protein [Burkholderiaceae bacterium]
MASDDFQRRVFETTRRLPFERSKVFAAFREPDLLARWWGPEGFTSAFQVFEFRPQGRWVFDMQGPDGTRYPNESVFLATSPERVVVQHVCAPFFTLAVDLTDLGGQTEVGWCQVFDDPAVADRVRHVVEPANEENLDRLHRCLAAIAQA